MYNVQELSINGLRESRQMLLRILHNQYFHSDQHRLGSSFNPLELSSKLFDIYLQQFFGTHLS